MALLRAANRTVDYSGRPNRFVLFQMYTSSQDNAIAERIHRRQRGVRRNRRTQGASPTTSVTISGIGAVVGIAAATSFP